MGLRPPGEVRNNVTIRRAVMEPWGWPVFPRTREQAIHVPVGTRGLIVAMDEHTVTVDYVLDETLYRTRFERQYIVMDRVMRVRGVG